MLRQIYIWHFKHFQAIQYCTVAIFNYSNTFYHNWSLNFKTKNSFTISSNNFHGADFSDVRTYTILYSVENWFTVICYRGSDKLVICAKNNFDFHTMEICFQVRMVRNVLIEWFVGKARKLSKVYDQKVNWNLSLKWLFNILII